MPQDHVPPPPDEVYPGAPLQAVAIEVHFAALLDAVTRLAPLQRSGFPRLSIPEGSGRPLLLQTEDRTRALGIASSQLAAVTYDYAGGHSAFFSWAVPAVRHGLQLLGTPTLSRVVYRYENLIGDPEGGVERVFSLGLPRPPVATGGARQPALNWVWPWRRGEIYVGLGMTDDEPDQLYATVAADCRSLEGSPLEISSFEHAVDDARQAARWTFETLITNEFRDVIRRDRR